MIRKFQSVDIEQVMRIWLNGNIGAHPFIPREYWENNFDMVQKQMAAAEIWVYESAGEILGFIGLMDSYIAGIFVDEAHRSLGIGRELLDYAKRNHRRLTLSVYVKNERAEAFYLREGFCVLSEGRDEATGEAEYTMVWDGGEV